MTLSQSSYDHCPAQMSPSARLEAVINLAKRRGFVFPCGDIYGGTRSAWDYGPLGVELKENIKRQWWNRIVRLREDVVGLDSSVILPRRVWEASGHVQAFTDPLIECLGCHKRLREDELVEAYAQKKGIGESEVSLGDITCPHCGKRGEFTQPKAFSGLLKTFLGPVDNEEGLHYLRPETAQGIFINFANVMTTSRMKPPFGIAQIGKSFRNEITPGNFIFRTREFEQMELEFFVEPGTDEKWHQYWIDEREAWYRDLGIRGEHLRQYEHPQEKLSHYSKRTVDLEYTFGFQGSTWGELEGIANRTNYDLSVHAEQSGQRLDYFDQEKGTRYVPYVIEPSAGLTRSLMAFMVEAYTEDVAPNTKGGVDKRVVLRLDRRLAPIKVAVLPLSRKPQLTQPARELAQKLRHIWNVDYDQAGAIGRRYRRQDEIGTPFCLTYDFDSLDDNCVTVRERDTMEQKRLPIEEITSYLAGELG